MKGSAGVLGVSLVVGGDAGYYYVGNVILVAGAGRHFGGGAVDVFVGVFEVGVFPGDGRFL